MRPNVYSEIIIIKSSFLNFNTINHSITLFIGIFISIANESLLVIGVSLTLVAIYDLFIDAGAINKVVINFQDKKLDVYFLYFAYKQETAFSELSRFVNQIQVKLDYTNNYITYTTFGSWKR